MPINESYGQKPSGLTKEQKQEQLAAIYGVETKKMGQLEQLQAQLQQLQQQIANMGGTNQPVGIQEIDFNNPKLPPYQHQEFPKFMHHKELGQEVIAKDKAHYMKLVGDGWEKGGLPVAVNSEPAPLPPGVMREVTAVDEQIEEARRKKKEAK